MWAETLLIYLFFPRELILPCVASCGVCCVTHAIKEVICKPCMETVAEVLL